MSGWWAAILCPCGIVYSVKFLLRMMSPTTHMFLLKNILHMQNKEKKGSILSKIQKDLGHPKTTINLQTDLFGRLVVGKFITCILWTLSLICYLQIIMSFMCLLNKENRAPEMTRLHLIKPSKACWGKPLTPSQRKLVI